MCTLCYVAGAAGDLQLVKRLAEIAIDTVPERATSLKERLASFIQDPSSAIPQIIDEWRNEAVKCASHQIEIFVIFSNNFHDPI